jgi:hypothetical protein
MEILERRKLYADTKTLKENIGKNVARSAWIMTDEWQAYDGLEEEFASHEIVDHGKGQYEWRCLHQNRRELDRLVQTRFGRYISPSERRALESLRRRIFIPLESPQDERQRKNYSSHQRN